MACFDEKEDACSTADPKVLQHLRDRVLIVVGDGPAAERLARRRLQHSGRLCVVEASPERVAAAIREDVGEELPDLWTPPSAVGSGRARSGLAAQLGDRPVRGLMKRGPDVAPLADDEQLRLLVWHGCHIGVRVVRGEETVWEMSGSVVLPGTMSGDEVDKIDVDVLNKEALPSVFIDHKMMFLCFAISLVTISLLFIPTELLEKTAKEGDLPWWRVSYCLVVIVGIGGPMAFPYWGASFTGFTEFPLPLLIGTLVVCFVVAFALTCLSMSRFLSSALQWLPISNTLATVGVYVTRKRAPQRATMKHALWGNLIVNLSLGVYLSYYAVILGYAVLIQSSASALASFYLPLATSIVESGTVMAGTWAYNHMIVKERRKKEGSIVGDQRAAIILNSCLAHSWGEDTRLVAIIAGTIMKPESYGWILTAFMCVLSNTSKRSGWQSFVMGWVGSRCRCTSWFCIGWPSVIHEECKTSCGYGRFIALLIFGIVRFAKFTEMDPNKPTFVFFNMMTLYAVIWLPLMEALEDILVYFSHKVRPAFQRWHASHYTKIEDPYSLSQLVATVRTPEGSNDVRLGSEKVRGRRQPLPAISMHGVRTMPFGYHLGVAICGVLTAIIEMECLFGSGYVWGVCDRPLEDMREMILQVFRVHVPYKCY